MAWSTPDLSQITTALQDMLQTAVNAASLTNIHVLCSSPDTARIPDSYCHLSIYLLHVGRDPYWRNTPVAGPRPQFNTAQPLSLNLSYLLTSWFDADFITEQQAMSVALQAIHSRPIYKTATEEFTVSIEADTIEEMSRLWQAITVPMRLSALIRVGVVFLAPALPQPVPTLPPTTANLAVAPEPLTLPTTLPMLERANAVRLDAVLPDAPSGTVIDAAVSAATAVGGGSFTLAGNALDLAQAAEVFLRVPGSATEWTVTAWRQAPPQPGALRLVFPSGYTDPATNLPVPPAALPLPGVYTLTVGRTVPASRSNPVTLAVAPRVTGVVNPPKLVAGGGGVYAIAGQGFVPAATTLSLGALALTETAAAVPLAGQFIVRADGTAIAFLPPSPAPPAGEYPVRLAVNGIPAAPGWVVVL